MSVKIGLVAPYPDLANLALEVCRELGEHVDVRQGDLSEGVRIAREMQRQGVEVIISRGGTALAIEQAVDVPVVTIQVSGFDIMRAIHAAREFGQSIGVIGFKNVIYGTDSVQDMLGVTLKLIYLDREADAEARIETAVRGGLRVIVGDAISTRVTARHGVKGVLIRSGKEAIVKAIGEAKHLAGVRRRERQRAEELKAILDFSYEGIVAVDQDGEIKFFNPIAERILHLNAADVIGKQIGKVLPGVNLDAVRTSGRPELGRIRRIGTTFIVSNGVPITVGKEVVGAVFTFQDARHIQQVEKEVRRELYLRGHVAKHTFGEMIATATAMREVIGRAKMFASTESTVLILGETGTGKELLAQSIHNASGRRTGPFVAINCAALPESLLESELFGYEEGAFTGSRKGGKPGLFELAHGGTIFLDEIGDMSLPIQARLLRVLEQREVMRLGGDRMLPVNVRIIAATHKELGKAVSQGSFRPDLYYRLNVLNLVIPPLRDRREDIPELAKSFLAASCERLGLARKTLSREAMDVLVAHSWPGNVRELRNACERLAVGVEGKEVCKEDVLKLLELTDGGPDVASRSMNIAVKLDGGGLRMMEEEIMRQVLEKVGGDRTEACRLLGINRSTLWRRVISRRQP
ncbi:MAG: sigma 54-interacting transcriptional regulator [Firmicutes bacterium]|jgi:propionate catabolism regulator PrpR|nr:sigma 54-interacting transcriptional regulator [Bacillota bacterium]MDH7494759.1 sigma 54-interacting transcriptional regulator [Bacillota bacterium]